MHKEERHFSQTVLKIGITHWFMRLKTDRKSLWLFCEKFVNILVKISCEQPRDYLLKSIFVKPTLLFNEKILVKFHHLHIFTSKHI